jgi:hypothetical protein
VGGRGLKLLCGEDKDGVQSSQQLHAAEHQPKRGQHPFDPEYVRLPQSKEHVPTVFWQDVRGNMMVIPGQRYGERPNPNPILAVCMAAMLRESVPERHGMALDHMHVGFTHCTIVNPNNMVIPNSTGA